MSETITHHNQEVVKNRIVLTEPMKNVKLTSIYKFITEKLTLLLRDSKK